MAGRDQQDAQSHILPEDYFALLEQSAGKAVPDVITHRNEVLVPPGAPPVGGPEAVAVAERPPQVDLMTMRTARSFSLRPFSLRQKRIVVRHTSGEVVAVIELVSPGNKRSAESVEVFCDKIATAILQGVHALIIDLTPPRKHDPDGMHGVIWALLEGEPFELAGDRPLLLASYEVNDGIEAYVKPLAVGDALPPMPLFLRSGWYVEVPLDTAYEATWEGAPRQWRGQLPQLPA